MLNLKKIISVLVLVASMATIMPVVMVASASGYGLYNVLYPKMDITTYSENSAAMLEWNSLTGLNSSFDKYNVLFKKGYYNELTGEVAKSYVDWNYYYLTGLTPGDWWTFQVVPVSLVNSEYVEVGARSDVYQIYIQGAVSSVIDAPVLVSPYYNQVYTNFPREAYLDWNAPDASNVSAYQIEIACDVCSSVETKWLNPSYYTTSNTYFTTPALAGDNEFRFRVRGYDSNNNYGYWSDYQYFSYDTSGAIVAEQPLSLWIDGWKGGAPSASWSAYQGDFDGYAMFIGEGYLDENEVTWGEYIDFGKNQTSYQLVKMYLNTDYTIRILPYKKTAISTDFIYPGSNTIVFTTGNEDDYYVDQTLPPAGYEDEVITSFDVYQSPFSDVDLDLIDGYAAAELYRRGVIGGYPDGEFKGWKEVNRAELAKFLLLARYGSVAGISNNGKFPDVLDGQWYVPFVVTAANLGIINGHPDGTFKPADTVNTAEFLKMLTLTFNLETNLDYSYTDVNSNAWYAQYSGIAEKYNLFPLRDDKLYPDLPLNRGVVALAIYQYLKNR